MTDSVDSTITRRTYLTLASTVTAGALAGCSGDGDSGDDGSLSGDSDSDGDTDSDDTTGTDQTADSTDNSNGGGGTADDGDDSDGGGETADDGDDTTDSGTTDDDESTNTGSDGDTTDQVATRLQAESVTGEVVDQTVSELTITVSKANTDETIDLTGVVIELIGPEGTAILAHEQSGDTGDGTFGHEVISDPDDSNPVVSSAEDRFTLRIDIGGTAEHGPLEAGESAVLVLNTASEESTEVRVQVPDTLPEDGPIGL